ncbi:MAG: RNA pseudouridine synthase [Phyllobacteriaceae bacterium]|nr:RNA pseudouridine synthase [Phyllobacteriaceae bacterium]MBA92125.1 RNA pseudouridine synthase [Phyllobacteriaceae bacterium]
MAKKRTILRRTFSTAGSSGCSSSKASRGLGAFMSVKSPPISDHGSGPVSENSAARKVLTAGPDAAGSRIDQWLASELAPDLSRARIQALVKSGAVTADGKPATEPKMKLAGGETIRILIPEPEPAAPAPQAIALDILYEDGELVVINKPAGLVVHPGAGNPDGTLVNALIHHCGDSLSGVGGVRRPGIVHRLDKDTSGVMVVAKTDMAHRALSEAFADHGRSGDLERAYWAIVWGLPARMAGTIDAALGRSVKDRTRRAVVRQSHPDARHAVTHFTTLERYGEKPDATADAALVECRLETGRTHQIRVHMAHIGHPLIGDREYGLAYSTKANRLPEDIAAVVRAFPRQALHARLLAFRHPQTGALMRFEADPPADMQALREALLRLPGLHA